MGADAYAYDSTVNVYVYVMRIPLQIYMSMVMSCSICVFLTCHLGLYTIQSTMLMQISDDQMQERFNKI